MFNVNDFFHGQVYHLLNSHDVAEIVYLAALRTLSSRHPVLNLRERLMYQAYAIRPIGDRVLFNPGAKDWELQAWIDESNGPAKVIDFPSAPLRSRKQLIDILTHMAWLTGVSHHVLNQGEPVTASGVLPLHPVSLYAPVPTKKGRIGNLLPWLPNEQKSVEQITLLARSNRPQVVEKNQALRYMFNADSFLAGTKKAVSLANDRCMKDTGSISNEISGRRFDGEGLSQGMPFIWTGMEPGVIPFYLSV
ncbi:hypothetical protein SGCOL_011711 [Colletotrichum sp. CLE4]